jgi:hypothetical protein
MEEVPGKLRKFHNEELHNLYSSPCIISVIVLRRVVWASHVAFTGDIRNSYKFWLVKLKERDNSEDLGIDGNILE